MRTLVVAHKELDAEEWSDWDDRYQAAASDLDQRDELVLLKATTLGQVKCVQSSSWCCGLAQSVSSPSQCRESL